MEQDLLENAHLIRITSHGKIRTWVEFALDFLDNNEDRSLVLHTLPAATDPTQTESTEQTPEESTNTQAARVSGKSNSCSATIPRLVTVAEIIKREHLKRLQANKSPVLHGVHQYNEVGCLEDLNGSQSHQVPDLMAALMGSKNVKIKRTIFMKITLCRKKLQYLVDKGATYQAPLPRQLSKSARQRAKKKQKKLMEATDPAAEGTST